MDNLFLALLLLSFVGLVVGLIKPQWVKMTSRKFAAGVFGGAAVVFFILFGITAPPATSQSTTVASTETPAPATSTVATQNAPQAQTAPSGDDQIKAAVSQVLQGQTNMSNENHLRSVSTTKDPQSGWDVSVEFNGDDNLTEHLTLESMQEKMSDVYIALFSTDLGVQKATVAEYLQLTDKYGNSNDQVVYRSTLDKETASKVNWSADKALLELQILPGVWTEDYNLFAIDPNL